MSAAEAWMPNVDDGPKLRLDRLPIGVVIADKAGTTVYDGIEHVEKSPGVYDLERDNKGPFVAQAFRAAFFEIMGSQVILMQFAIGPFESHPSVEEINRVMGWKKEIAIESLLRDHYGLLVVSPHLVSLIHNRFQDCLVNFYKDVGNLDAREIQGTTEAFEAVNGAGARIYLNTGFQERVSNAIDESPNFVHWFDDAGKGPLVSGSVNSSMVERGRPTDELIQAVEIKYDEHGIPGRARMAVWGDTASDIRAGINGYCALVIGIEGTRTRRQLRNAVFEPSEHYDPETFLEGHSVVLIVRHITEAAAAVAAWNEGEDSFEGYIRSNPETITLVTNDLVRDGLGDKDAEKDYELVNLFET